MFSEVSWDRTLISSFLAEASEKKQNWKKLNGTRKQIAIQPKTDKNNSNANSFNSRICFAMSWNNYIWSKVIIKVVKV